MPITFNDSPDLKFEYQATIPDRKINKINLAALKFYGIYRNAVYNSYGKKSDLAQDIKEYKKAYEEMADSKLSHDDDYLNPLYHYSVNASLGVMQEWQDTKKNIHCYMASKYISKEHRYIPVGFIHFEETKVDGKPVVYIAQMGVAQPNKSIGRRLMECVLSHYPEGTIFYVLTRIFNTEAKTLYQKRFNFASIEEAEIRQLGYDDRYYGFKHTTTLNEIQTINEKIIREDHSVRMTI